MPKFPVHDVTSAPERSRPILEQARRALGFVPNLYGVLAESPALLKGYTTLAAGFEGCSLSAAERQVVLLTTSFENGCDYCMAAHSAIARMQHVPEGIVAAVRDGATISDPKLEALRGFTRELVRRRGWVPAADVQTFLDVGYTTEQVLEVIVGVGLKTLSNYANHLAGTPLDAAFKGHAWSKPALVAAP
ncbi:MAG: carboxymuconolactone decarboxylase family protein [Candidatus Polarisedimenticolia bacterium]